MYRKISVSIRKATKCSQIFYTSSTRKNERVKGETELYPQNQVQNQPTAAYWLSIIGGILGILGSIALFAFGAIVYSAYNNVLGYYGNYYYNGIFFGWGWSIFIGLGIWTLISSIMIIIFAIKLKANPTRTYKMGYTHSGIFHNRSRRRNSSIDRRHISISLQPYTPRNSATIQSTTTNIRSSTTKNCHNSLVHNAEESSIPIKSSAQIVANN